MTCEGAGQVDNARFTSSCYQPGKIRHIVLFRFKSEVGTETRQLVIDKFVDLKNTALRDGKPYIVSIEAGIQNSLEGLEAGFELGFIVTFNSEGDRNFYVGTPAVIDSRYFDPAHEDLKKFVKPYLADGSEGVLVFDFNVK